ncbi:hypothetical protein BDV95DRAFT_632574 [Massariosphaeria phaeospora]|uniref:FAD-binding FR-type domain-containing protein n=1 Tax=Massariosphaeria phaeospora TaxID=100035 RepID=A0A7C8HYG5_9PLEO|nr:hypothetical protein BDV95DRAFT_632574 [Massariosphaeria phaeospora]
MYWQPPLWKKKHNTPFQISSAIDNGTLPRPIGIRSCSLFTARSTLQDGAVIAALRGRTGTLAALNLIPTVLFALRNNPLITLLQVSYDDFNLFHRWCARVTILEALVHTVSWMTFLNIHRITVIGALVGLYLHLERHGLPQIPWMHLIVVFWAGEWIIRLFMIWYYGFKLSRKSAIKVEAMPGEAVRVTIDLVRPWHSRPGCHVHLWVPGMSQLTSHPFSVAWAPPASPTSKEMTLPTLEGQVLAPNAPAKANQISLICRARTGLTRKMYERAANSPNETFSTFGFIEGPYGGHHSLDSYGTVLLFAGGVGITHQVMYLKHLIAGFHRSTTATQKLVLIWTVPDAESLEWVRPWMDEILRMPGRKQVLRVKLFITRPKAPLHNNSETVKMFAGRPKTATLIEEECRTRVGAMAVTVCGSGPFADDVRAAVRPVLTEGSVDFIEEAFTY